MLKLAGVYLQYGGANTYLNLGWESFPSSDGQDSANRAMTPAASRSLLHLAARHNLRVNTLVRDTLEEVLTIFVEVHGVTPIDDRRSVINHVLQASPQQLQRINKLGLVV